jgi:glutamine amidotransferase PdxT
MAAVVGVLALQGSYNEHMAGALRAPTFSDVFFFFSRLWSVG